MHVGVQQSTAEQVGAVAERPPNASVMASIGVERRRYMIVSEN
jgi:hypothetical protein